MRIVFIIFMLALLGQTVMAQDPCGVGHEESLEITKRLLANKQMIKDGFVKTRNETIFVPIKFHIIARTEGTGGIDESDVLQQLALLNRDYLAQDIQFYIDSGFNYINNTATFNDPSSGVANLVLGNNKLNGRINIFIPSTAMTGSGNPGTTLGFYSPFNDWIVIRQAEVRRLTITLTHELGHFLSLLHPHNGWDSAEFLANIAEFTPTPEFSPRGIPTENQDRTGPCRNCETAGDFICDTPPDYNFGFGFPGCNYNLGTLDPCDELVDPQENLFMSYFLNGCDPYEFSNDQKELMEADLATRITQNTIFGSLTPDTVEPVEGEVIANFPPNNGFSTQAQSVFFDWDDVPGATDYIFQVSRSILNLNSGITQVITTNGESQVSISGEFLPGEDYVWRIYPFNQTSTGFGFSETFRFTTGEVVAVETIEEISSFELYPNILTSGNEVVLDINSDASFDAEIQVINVAGQVVMSRSNNIVSGSNRINLNMPELAQGVYFVKLSSDRGINSKKLIVQ